MAQTAKHIREAYNAKTYRPFTFRIRRDSDLFPKLEAAAEKKELNALVTKLLTAHYANEPKILRECE
jgi:predicted DNA-binding protein with PD1-like motif